MSKLPFRLSFEKFQTRNGMILLFQRLCALILLLFISILIQSFLKVMDLRYVLIPIEFKKSGIIEILFLFSLIILILIAIRIRLYKYRFSTIQYYFIYTGIVVYCFLRFSKPPPYHWEYITFSKWDIPLLDIPLGLIFLVFIFSFIREFIIPIQTNTNVYLEDNPYLWNEPNPQQEQLLSKIDPILFLDTYEKAFSIGVVGTWGAGKSSFLCAVEKRIAAHKNFEKTIVHISFSPFLNHNEDKVIHEFFVQFSNELSKRSGRLTNKLITYANKLSNAIKNKNPINLFDSVSNSNDRDSVSELYEDILDTLKSLNIKIIVTIDDLDRLSGKEILQVLKLIRNTANFPNTVFIVALDKNYVVKALNNEKEYMKEDFLDKFFQLELHVSKTSSEVVKDFTLSTILKSLRQLELIETQVVILNKAFQHGSLNFEKFLLHYRDAKRFVNQFILDFQLVNEANINSEEIRYHDFCVLTLLKVFCSADFSDLKHGSSNILQKSNRHKNYWELSGVTDKPTNDIRSVSLLKSIFPEKENDSSTPPRNSIVYDKTLRLYFERTLATDELSEHEFNSIYSIDDIDILKTAIIDLGRSSGKLTSFINKVITQEQTDIPEELFKKASVLMYAMNQEDSLKQIYFQEFRILFEQLRETDLRGYHIQLALITFEQNELLGLFKANVLKLVEQDGFFINKQHTLHRQTIITRAQEILDSFSSQINIKSFAQNYSAFCSVYEMLYSIDGIREMIPDYTQEKLLVDNEITFLKQSITINEVSFTKQLNPILFKLFYGYQEIIDYAKEHFNNSSDELLEYLDFVELCAITENSSIIYDFKHLKPITPDGEESSIGSYDQFGQIIFECRNDFKGLIKDSVEFHDFCVKYNPKYSSFNNKVYWRVPYTINDRNSLLHLAKDFQKLSLKHTNPHLAKMLSEGPIAWDKDTNEALVSIRSIQPFVDLKFIPANLTEL